MVPAAGRHACTYCRASRPQVFVGHDGFVAAQRVEDRGVDLQPHAAAEPVVQHSGDQGLFLGQARFPLHQRCHGDDLVQRAASPARLPHRNDDLPEAIQQRPDHITFRDPAGEPVGVREQIPLQRPDRRPVQEVVRKERSASCCDLGQARTVAQSFLRQHPHDLHGGEPFRDRDGMEHHLTAGDDIDDVQQRHRRGQGIFAPLQCPGQSPRADGENKMRGAPDHTGRSQHMPNLTGGRAGRDDDGPAPAGGINRAVDGGDPGDAEHDDPCEDGGDPPHPRLGCHAAHPCTSRCMAQPAAELDQPAHRPGGDATSPARRHSPRGCRRLGLHRC